jgi:6-phosphogluconolactonase (cycloisomerase 2 family)
MWNKCKWMLVAAALLAFPAAASAAPPPIGGLTQLPGTAGCVATSASGSCQVAYGIYAPESALVSPDGRFVYSGSYPANNSTPGLAAFSRDPSTGQLTQLPGKAGCYTPDGSSQAGAGTCTSVRGLGDGDGSDFAITSDGQWAYMVTQSSSPLGVAPGIVIFRRDPATGALTQLPGTAGCVSSNGSSQAGPGTCQTLSTLTSPNGITLSSDDRFAYVTDAGSHAIHVLARDPATGELTEVQCLYDGTGVVLGCTLARSVGNAQSIVISPDGTHAYAADYSANGISILDRDPATGLLSEKTGAAGCISEDGADSIGQSTCATGRVLSGAYAMSISPDGQTLFVSAYNANGVAIFHVNADGTLTQLAGTAGCVTIDGKDESGSPTCAAGRALHHPYGSTVSPDGRTLYVTEFGASRSEGGVAVFSIDRSSGALTQLAGTAGCITGDGTWSNLPGLCAADPALAGTYQPAVSPDGKSVYVASFNGDSLTTFTRETGPTCSAAGASTAYQTAITVALSCTDADGDPLTTSILAAPAHGTLGQLTNGTVTYTPAAGYSGPDSFTFDATDGSNPSAPATVTITVGAPAPPSVPVAPAAPAPPAPPPATSPKLSHVTQAHRTWHEGKHGGTTFTFTLNEAAQVTFTFTATQKHHQHTLGRLTIKGRPGKNKVAFDGIINRHAKLKPGTYTVTITTSPGTPQRLTFTIVK